LRTAYNNRARIKLEKPIKNGWYMHLQIREAYLGKSNSDILIDICNAVTIKAKAWHKSDCQKKWKRKLKKGYDIRLPGMQGISRQEMKKLSPKAKAFFVYYGHRYGYKSEPVYMCMLPRYYFQTTYSRAYITHVIPYDATVIKRLEEIEQILQSRKYYKYSWNGSRCTFWDIENKHRRERQRVRLQLLQRIKN